MSAKNLLRMFHRMVPQDQAAMLDLADCFHRALPFVAASDGRGTMLIGPIPGADPAHWEDEARTMMRVISAMATGSLIRIEVLPPVDSATEHGSAPH